MLGRDRAGAGRRRELWFKLLAERGHGDEGWRKGGAGSTMERWHGRAAAKHSFRLVWMSGKMGKVVRPTIATLLQTRLQARLPSRFHMYALQKVI